VKRRTDVHEESSLQVTLEDQQGKFFTFNTG